MRDSGIDELLARLIANLDAVGRLLRDHAEKHWQGWATACRHELLAHLAAGLDRAAMTLRHDRRSSSSFQEGCPHEPAAAARSRRAQ
ncbi:MAG: hypothetical protein ACTHQ3_05130 [Motilibacteraceae bacterium]